jgi:hypothetical protein
VQDPAYTERRVFEAVATEIGNRSVNAGAKIILKSLICNH